MTALRAIELMIEGKKIRRTCWIEGEYIKVDGSIIVDEMLEPYSMILDCEDYEIYVEKEWRWKYACLYDGEMVVSVDYMTAFEAEERGYGEDNKLKFTAKEFIV